MARRRRRQLARDSGGSSRRRPLAAVAVALPLLLLAYYGCRLAAAKQPATATAAVDTPGGMRMNVKYSPDEVKRWMDRMTNSPDSPFRPATDQENAFFNRMAAGGGASASFSFSNNGGGGYRQKKTATTRGGAAGGGGRSTGSGAAGVRPGFDGHIEFSDQFPTTTSRIFSSTATT